MSFLTKEERGNLIQKHREEKNRRNADRCKAILLSDSGWTNIKIAEVLFIDSETVGRHINEYKDSQKTENKTGGSESKLTTEQTKELIDHLETQTYVSSKDISAYVKSKYQVDYSGRGMRSWLYINEFSFKKPKGVPAKANAEKQKQFVEYYEKFVLKTPENEPILFFDAVHPTMATKITYGWIRKGKNKEIKTTASRTRMNLAGSFNLAKMEIIIGDHETINTESIEKHFQQVKMAYPDAPKIHMILDNGPYNIAQLTKDNAIKYGIILHYLPPYSPNLNPIERLWKVMNEYVRNNKHFESPKIFRQEIHAFFEEKWPEISHLMIDRINDNFRIVNT